MTEYRVPSMSEIESLPWNGFKVASTFAGGGGSSTGYRMAGFRVVYANEFVEAARSTYAENMSSSTLLDGRDIRQITADDLLSKLNLDVGELDVLDGSPPCASFSTAGRRHKKWGEVSKYSDTEQRTDDLFYEFARILEGVQPKVFVAENVSGLVKGTAKGYFKRILTRLESTGYTISVRLLDAQWLGVPQSRQRVIFVGVRNDLNLSPAHPSPFDTSISLKEALSADDDLRLLQRHYGELKRVREDLPCQTVTATGVGAVTPDRYVITRGSSAIVCPETSKSLELTSENVLYRDVEKAVNQKTHERLLRSVGVTRGSSLRMFSIPQLRSICGFPTDYVLTGTYEQRWERLGRSVPPLMMKAIAETVRDEILMKSESVRSDS